MGSTIQKQAFSCFTSEPDVAEAIRDSKRRINTRKVSYAPKLKIRSNSLYSNRLETLERKNTRLPSLGAAIEEHSGIYSY